MSDRTHFVYRVYDEFGLLLYVGCTGSPERRLKQHRGDKAPWLPYMASARMEGPYSKANGFAQEKSVIATEAPYFNALPDQMAHNLTRRKVLNDRLDDLRRREPDLFGANKPHDPVRFAKFQGHYEEIARVVDESMPERGREYRLNRYLDARRREQVKSA